ncbi:hypothetical protein OPIT5_09925 [Opitutaceae bacterium TAV5]|nr:hypothetical protein OPIT5_09925 [Opitutaceae bacterium TAV5]
MITRRLLLVSVSGFQLLCASLPAATFGTGQAGLTAAGNDIIRLDTPETRLAIRFTAATDGELTEVAFASGHGSGYAANQPDAFTVTLHADTGGRPGERLATADRTTFNATGARLRAAAFSGVAIKAGTVLHAVIAAPAADAARYLSIESSRLPQGVVPVQSLDMTTRDPAAGVLVSTDAGATWSARPQTIAAHRVTISDRTQGWAYTGTLDLRLRNGPAGKEYPMQNFRFLTGEAGGKASVTAIRISLRPQGGLVNKPVKVFARILEDPSLRPLVSAGQTVTLADAARFEPVTLPVTGDATLQDGTDYVLVLGLSDEVSAGEKDFLFMRAPNWGIGSPNLNDLNWQTGANAVTVSRAPDRIDGSRFPTADMPFLIEYN